VRGAPTIPKVGSLSADPGGMAPRRSLSSRRISRSRGLSRLAGFAPGGSARARGPTPPALSFDYVGRTRALPVNLLFLAPFVVVYEAALVATRSPVENAAAALHLAPFASLGHAGMVVLSLLLGLAFLALMWSRRREAPRERGIYGGMLLEGTLYWLLLGVVAQALASTTSMGRVVPLAAQAGAAGSETLASLSHGVRDLGLAVGAGVFEEVVFRGLLLTGLIAVLRLGLTADRLTACGVGLLISAYVFSAYHHWGPFGEPYHAGVFAFRFHAGLVLGVLFLSRGLGIAALAHGVYDVWVTLGARP